LFVCRRYDLRTNAFAFDLYRSSGGWDRIDTAKNDFPTELLFDLAGYVNESPGGESQKKD